MTRYVDGYPCVKAADYQDFRHAPDYVHKVGHLHMLLGLVHQHSAYNESQHGYCYEYQCKDECNRVSKSEPCCVGEWNIQVQEYDGEQDRESDGSYELIFSQKITGKFCVQ